jgi:hypothetical protein
MLTVRSQIQWVIFFFKLPELDLVDKEKKNSEIKRVDALILNEKKAVDYLF